MNPLWWILIAIAILLLVALFVIALTKASKQAEQIDKLLTGAKVINYCFIYKNVLAEIFSEEELVENKYRTRPFICLTSNYLKQHNLLLVIPQKTNRKTRVYNTDFYLANGTYKLSTESCFLVNSCKVDLKSHFAKQDVNKKNLQEIISRQDELVSCIASALKRQPDKLDELKLG